MMLKLFKRIFMQPTPMSDDEFNRIMEIHYKKWIAKEMALLPSKYCHPKPVNTLSTIPEWKAAYDAATIARAKHSKVKPHVNAMRAALHKNLGMM